MKKRRKTMNRPIGRTIEIARAARKTSSCNVSRMSGRRTDSGWISGSGSTTSGHK
jgi:hypothetical protein